VFVPELNRLMASSYLILDEYLRFLDKTGKQPSESVLEVGVQRALESVFWDEDAFLERGGLYDWTKPESEKSCGTAAEMLDCTSTQDQSVTDTLRETV
jgi:radical S-adenosyl methionine domain-containing protein 2